MLAVTDSRFQDGLMRQAKDAGKLPKNFEIPRRPSRQSSRADRGCAEARARGRPVAVISVRQRFYRSRAAADSGACRSCRTRSARRDGWPDCCGRVLSVRPMPPTANAWRGSGSTSPRHGPSAPIARWSSAALVRSRAGKYHVVPARRGTHDAGRSLAGRLSSLCCSIHRGAAISRPRLRRHREDRQPTCSCSPACASR